MKFLFKLMLAALIVVALLWLGVTRGVPVLLADLLRAHGAAMTGSSLQVQDSALAWEQRVASFSGIALAAVADSTGADAQQARIARLDLRLPATFVPRFESLTLLPEVVELDAVVLSGIELAYDVDTVGGNLRLLRQRLSVAASEALRDRLNVRKGTSMTRQLFVARSVQLKGITVSARSVGNPEKSRSFLVGPIELSDVGVNEKGVAGAEIVDQASRRLVDEIQRQAILQGIVEVAREGEGRAARDNDSAAAPEGDEGAAQKDENRVKKAARQVKEGFQDLGRGLKRGFKEIVN